MTNESIALVAILSNAGIPEGSLDSGMAAVELSYWRHDADAYRRAVDVLNRCGLLSRDLVEVHDFPPYKYERIRVGAIKLVGPTDLLYATSLFEQAEAPVARLARCPVEGPTPIRPRPPALALVHHRDPGDENDGPDAA